MTLKIEKLDRAGFAPFGKILDDRRLPPLSPGEEFSWEDQAAGLELADAVAVG